MGEKNKNLNKNTGEKQWKQKRAVIWTYMYAWRRLDVSQ